MNHPAELAVRAYLNKAVKGEGTISEDNLEQIASDIKSALTRQFAGPPREDFRLRMSNLGRPTCQLWYDKNKPEVAEPFPSNFLMNMVLGDLVEAVFKGLLREANVEFNDSSRVTLKIGGTEIKGECDLTKYVSAQDMNLNEVNEKIKKTITYIKEDMPFERCYKAEAESYRKELSGNYILPRGCTFCKYKRDGWDTLQELPSKVSKAKELPMVQYVSLAEPVE